MSNHDFGLSSAATSAESLAAVSLEREVGRSRARRAPRRLDHGLLLAVVTVVALVSVPRLRDWTLHSNELDARAALRLLADTALAPVEATGDATGDPAHLGETYLANALLRHRLQDARVIDEGHKLRYHGYYYARVERPGESVLVAWPCAQGRSGNAIYVLANDGNLFSHPDPPHFEFDRDLSPPALAQVWQTVRAD